MADEKSAGDQIEGEVKDSSGVAIGSEIEQVTNRPQASTAVTIYNTPPPRPRRERRSSSGMAATVEEKIRDKLNEHDVKLARLELVDETVKTSLADYVRELRQDVVEIKAELRPLKNQGILAQPPPMADKEAMDRAKEQNKLVLRLLTIIAISFGVGVILFVIFFVWLTLTRA